MAEEKVLIHSKKQIEHNNTPQNQVGSGIQTGLRDIPTPGGDIAYVRKFGLHLAVKSCTVLEDPIDVNLTMELHALDGTLLASRVGGGAFVPGTAVTTAQGCYLDCIAGAADVTLNTFGPVYSMTTDAGAYAMQFETAEVIYAGDTLSIYLSQTESTYYDSELMYGGHQHTPALNDPLKPYFHSYDAHAACATANDDGVEVLDKKTYGFPYYDKTGAPAWRYELDMNKSGLHFYSSDGLNPKIKSIIGASVEREVSAHWNNVTAIYFNENGTNADVAITGYQDTWQDPYGTIANAILAAAAKGVTNIIYGGTGATINNGLFPGALTIPSTLKLEPEYGYISTIRTGDKLILTAHLITFEISGFEFHTGNHVIWHGINNTLTLIIHNCTMYDIVVAILGSTFDNATDNLTVKNCLMYNTSRAINIAQGICVIENNYIYNCSNDGILLRISSTSMTIQKNKIYDNHFGISMKFTGGADVLLLSQNTIIQNDTGVLLELNGVLTETIQNNIIYNNTLDLDKIGTDANPSISFSCYTTSTNWTNGGNNISTDPNFCKITLAYKFGLSANSACHKSGSDGDDRGARLRIIEINESDIEISGIQFDGNGQFNNAIYISDSANHTGMSIKWCNVFDFQGIPIDPYDDNTNTDCIISNNKIYRNGNGLKLSYGGNTVEENIFWNNSVYGIWSNYTGQTFNHNVFFNNQYGMYFESNSGNIIIKNCITSQNSLYGIYSEVAIAITYCDISDAINGNVDITDTLNTTDNPLFINTESETENFNIKTIETGYTVDSVCKDASDDTDFPDIGAYDIARSVANEWWQSYQLEFNPENLNLEWLPKSFRSLEDGIGSIFNYAKSHKMILPMIWSADRATSETEWKTIRQLNTLIPTRENGLVKDNCTFRIHLVPDAKLWTGTATIDATVKTLTDTTKSWVDNENKGFWTAIIFDSDNDNGSEIFYAGNEVDLSEWTTTSLLNGTVTRDTPGLDSTVGKLNCNIPAGAANNRAYIYKSGIPITKNSQIMSFSMNVSDLTMANNDNVWIARLLTTASLFVVEMTYTVAAGHQLRIRGYNDAAASFTTALYPISSTGDVVVQCLIRKATTAVSNDGICSFWVNGDFKETIPALDNFVTFEGAGVTQYATGLLAGVDVGTLDSLYVDECYLVEGDAMLLDATNKTGIVPTATWTDDEWIGYYFYYNNNYYYITNNNSNVLFFSDPDNTLINGVTTDWTIEKYFRIASNTPTVLTLEDNDSELVSGSHSYYVDFIECRLQRSEFSYTQNPRFKWSREFAKSGYAIIFEES